MIHFLGQFGTVPTVVLHPSIPPFGLVGIGVPDLKVATGLALAAGPERDTLATRTIAGTSKIVGGRIIGMVFRSPLVV